MGTGNCRAEGTLGGGTEGAVPTASLRPDPCRRSLRFRRVTFSQGGWRVGELLFRGGIAEAVA